MVLQYQSATNQPGNPTGTTGARVAGFTESVYSDDDGLHGSRFNELCRRRAALLPVGTRIVGQRYQKVNPVGRMKSTGVVYVAGSGLLADVPQMALQVPIQGVAVRNVRNYVFRAIPDARSVVGEFQPSAAFVSALRSFINQLAVFRFKGADLDQPQSPLLGVSDSGLYTTTLPFAVVAGDLVQVLRCRTAGSVDPNGLYRIGAGPTTTTGTLLGWEAGPGLKGTIRKAVTIYPFFDPAGDGEPVIVVKKVGRPSKGYRGRQSAKR